MSSRVIANTDYSILPEDDYVAFVLSIPAIAKLPTAASCTGTQANKTIVSSASSFDILTIAIQDGDTLVGPSTMQDNQTMSISSDGVNTWTGVVTDLVPSKTTGFTGAFLTGDGQRATVSNGVISEIV